MLLDKNTKNMKELTEKFVLGLRRNQISDTFIYYNIFSILQHTNPEFLQEPMENYEKHPDDWFRLFHKSIRQYDYFNSDFVGLIKRNITEEELEFRSKLQKLRREFRKSNPDEYKNDELYISYGKKLFALNYKMNTYIRQEENISGHLDSILYELISNGKDELYQYMNKFFKDNKQIK